MGDRSIMVKMKNVLAKNNENRLVTNFSTYSYRRVDVRICTAKAYEKSLLSYSNWWAVGGDADGCPIIPYSTTLFTQYVAQSCNDSDI